MKQLLFIGGPRYSGVTSIAKRICDKAPDYHYLDLKVCLAGYYGTASGDGEGFEKWFIETVQMLPEGVTVIDCGVYAYQNELGTYQPIISAKCLEKIDQLPDIQHIGMILLDVDARNLQRRRMAAPFTTCRTLQTDLYDIGLERIGQIVAFGEYVDALCPPGSRRFHLLYQCDNVIEEVTAKRVGLLAEALRRATSFSRARLAA